jgi:preprotein translocase subunit SecD
MCTGLEIAALLGSGLSAAGGFVQQQEMAKNQQRMAEARNNELKRTLVKNDALAKQSRDTFNQRQQDASAERIEQERADKTDQRTQVLEQAVDTAPPAVTSVSLSGSAPQVVQSEMAKRIGSALADGKQQAQAQAKLGGYGDSWLSQGFQDVEAGRGIAQDANFAAGNMALLPYQQDIAEMRAHKPISPIGGLLQGFGSMLGSYGGGGGVPKRTYSSPAAGGLW